MLTADQVLETYYPDARWMLIEVAAMLDRYDRAAANDPQSVDPHDPRLESLRGLIRILAEESSQPDRAERMLRLLSVPAT